ncbi:hypothetical protein IMSHALPRED_001046 [Imshaugia aleurites]|uniref:Uncharacterized protein n=1 Tax=Imshaugia aleurites TaxID=172621 RepID=A0A8H3J0Y3_9LECA|nr:hypothetical protein IMSHALPRED_001046 [Imshaugia aleurites]
MHSPFLKVSILFALSFLANARPQTQAEVAIGAVEDWVSSGNYLIYSCLSRAPYVKDLLDLTYLYLQTAILSTDTPAYQAFFHTADPAVVTTILRAITAGANWTTLDHVSSRPTLVCANDYDPGLGDFWAICSKRPGLMLFQAANVPHIVACPNFFEKTQAPQSADCGVVNHANTQLIGHTNVATTQYGFLVNELAMLYIREKMPGQMLGFKEVGGLNQCLALPPDRAVTNPASYAWFVASM